MKSARILLFASPSTFIRTLLVGASLIFTARADQTNVVARLREKISPKATVWGEPQIGKSVRVAVDPRANALLDAFGQILGRPPATPATTLRAAAVNSGSAAAIEALKAQAGPNVELFVRPGNGTIMQLRGGLLEPTPQGLLKAADAAEPERTARRFLRNNRALLRLNDPDVELRLESEQRDESGRRHLRFSQWYQGLRLSPSGLSVHLDPNGNVESVDGAYVPTPAGLETKPTLRSEEAAQSVGGSGQTRDFSLVIYSPLDRPPRLAWQFHYSTDLFHAWRIMVDAQNGQVLNRATDVLDVASPGSGKDLEGINRNLNVWSAGGNFYMVDTSKKSFDGKFDPIADPHGAISIFDARNTTQDKLKTVFIVQSTAANDWIPDAVSALYNFGHTFDYFFERHGRNSLDGNGGNVQAVVRVAEMDNAFWSGDLKMMFFGTVRPYPLALDVVGHELAHGVTQNSADLIYELQPGALNESFSDIFGELVEARVVGQADWELGKKLGKVYRNLKNPGAIQIEGLNRPYPAKMSEFLDLPNSNDADHGGVHLNSSIVNHAFYMLAEGLNGAIGLIDAGKIFYACLTQRLQRQSQFVDARLGCVAAAEALFGANSTQARKTAEAFDTVEIFATPPTPEPTPIPAVQGPDSTLLIAFDPFFGGSALGRRELAFQDPLDGIALVDSVRVARPSVSGDGSVAAFVDGAFDICVVRTDNGGGVGCVGMQGSIHSVAMSPDATLIAVVLRDPATGQPDNRISILNLAQNTTKTYELLAPTVDGTPVDNVLYADSMVFTADGKQLIYDAVSEIRFGGGAAVQRWSIFRLNLPTEATTVLVPPIDGVSSGNPNIARTTGRFLTFDAEDVASGTTFIVNMDLFTGDIGAVGAVGQGAGYPCFNGDDTAVVYATRDSLAPQTGFSLVAQPLKADRLGTNGAASLWLRDANLGVIYRRGAFTNANAVPTVALTAPANNASFSAPGRIPLSATAIDADGTVAKVEFYQGGTKLGESTTAPYGYLWTPVPAGNYRLFARAIDNLGGSADSEPINITVGQTTIPSSTLTAARLTNGAIRLTLSGPAASYTIQQSTDLANWADIFPLTIGATGSGSLDDSGGPANNRRLFYRARKN